VYVIQAAEALGAIGQADCVDVLKRALEVDPAQEVRETCALALKRLEQVQETNEVQGSRFFTVDPAMPAPVSTSVSDLRYRSIVPANMGIIYSIFLCLFIVHFEGKPYLMRKRKCMHAMLLCFH
jgi:deoxyhypusine monooxygenase